MLKKFIVVLVVFVLFSVFCYTLFLTSLDISYLNIITLELQKYDTKLDAATILSVIKIESNFTSNVVSKKGAVGMMQLLPSTAQFIVDNYAMFNNEDIGYIRKHINLYDASINIKLGIWYLVYLENKFKDIYYILASYNAGEGVVNGWISNNIAIADIPYKETKKYISTYKLYYPNYKLKLNILRAFAII